MKAKAELEEVIARAKGILGDRRLADLRNYRNKHLAHSLTVTQREKRTDVEKVKYDYPNELLDASMPIIETLCRWVDGTSFSLEERREIERGYAEALWKGCTFTVDH